MNYKKKKILILVEKNKFSGLGHFKRMQVLYRNLSNIFFVRFELYRKKINLKKYKNFDLIIIDVSFNPIKIINFFKKFNKKTITFDNFYNSAADLNLSTFEHNKKLKIKRYSDLNLILFDKKKIKKNKSNKKYVFVSLGSKDRLGRLLPLKLWLEKNKITYKIFFGKYENKKNIKKNYITNYNKYFNYLSNAHWCILNAGQTLLEAMVLKKPAYVLPQTSKELNFSNFLIEKKLILGNSFEKLEIPNEKKLSNLINLLNKTLNINGINIVKKKINNIINEKNTNI